MGVLNIAVHVCHNVHVAVSGVIASLAPGGGVPNGGVMEGGIKLFQHSGLRGTAKEGLEAAGALDWFRGQGACAGAARELANHIREGGVGRKHVYDNNGEVIIHLSILLSDGCPADVLPCMSKRHEITLCTRPLILGVWYKASAPQGVRDERPAAAGAGYEISVAQNMWYEASAASGVWHGVSALQGKHTCLHGICLFIKPQYYPLLPAWTGAQAAF